jgi:effector-binding domain-containing protein
MRGAIISTVVTILLAQVSVQAQDKYTQSPMKVTQLKTTAYFYVTEQTTLANIGPVLTKRMAELTQAFKDRAFEPSSGPICIYHGATSDPNKPFTVDIGYPVTGDVPAGGDYKLGQVQSALAATTLYMGPISQIGQAYGRLYGQVYAAGHVPTDVYREHYLYWEDDQSSNNVVMIEILLQK